MLLLVKGAAFKTRMRIARGLGEGTVGRGSAGDTVSAMADETIPEICYTAMHI